MLPRRSAAEKLRRPARWPSSIRPARPLAFLQAAGVPFTAVQSLDNLPAGAKVLVVGRDAIEAERQHLHAGWPVYASEGRAVIVLDQTNPLKYQAIPAEMELAPRTKKNDFGTEVPTAEAARRSSRTPRTRRCAGLQDKDFFTWPGRPPGLPQRLREARRAAARAWCSAARGCEYSALVEVPVGKGVMYLSQLDIGGKLAANPVAQHAPAEPDRHAARTTSWSSPTSRPSIDRRAAWPRRSTPSACSTPRPPMPLAAISDPDKKIALVSATPANLKPLAGNLDALQAFWQRGGTLMLAA